MHNFDDFARTKKVVAVLDDVCRVSGIDGATIIAKPAAAGRIDVQHGWRVPIQAPWLIGGKIAVQQAAAGRELDPCAHLRSRRPLQRAGRSTATDPCIGTE